MFDTAKFGAYVAKLRKAADLTQSELGDRLNLTRQAISRYECGESFPDIAVVRKLASIFDIPLELLISSGEPTSGEAELLEAVASEREVVADARDVASLAPLLKPSVLTRLCKNLAREGFDVSSFYALAEYLNDTDAEALIEKVEFDSIEQMDVNLLEKLLPLLGPYAQEVIFRKIIDGELDYRYLELLGSVNYAQVEAAVVFGALDCEALEIMRRSRHNAYRVSAKGVAKIFVCPGCGEPLPHFYPKRCKCGCYPRIERGILTLASPGTSTELNPRENAFTDVNGELVLMLGAANIEEALTWCYDGRSSEREIIVLDDDYARLSEAERVSHSRKYSQIQFVHDRLDAPHLTDAQFDAIVDNTAARLGGTLRRVLK